MHLLTISFSLTHTHTSTTFHKTVTYLSEKNLSISISYMTESFELACIIRSCIMDEQYECTHATCNLANTSSQKGFTQTHK